MNRAGPVCTLTLGGEGRQMNAGTWWDLSITVRVSMAVGGAG